MYLSKEEEKILDGESGTALQNAMQILVAIGDIYGAERLIPISSAHLLTSYKSHEIFGIEWIEGFVEKGARAHPNVMVTTNPGSVDLERWREMEVSEDLVRYQARLNECYIRLGAVPLSSCIPYLLGNIPLYGEHYSWSGSSGQVFANSVLGARGNREGGIQSVASAIVGKTPLYGLHLEENRFGNVLVKLEGLDFKNLSPTDYAAIGYYVGKSIVDKIPVFVGGPNYMTLEQLRSIAYSVATAGSVPMFHWVGVTPEAKTLEIAFGHQKPEEKLTVGLLEAKKTYEELTTTGKCKVDAVIFGCPHCTINEIKEIAFLLKGRRIRKDVKLWVGTSMQVREVAKRMGLTDIIERAGGMVIADTCCGPSIPLEYVKSGIKVVATNSIKTAFYVPGTCKADVILLKTKDCIDLAVEEGG
jgi:predicted aconitase